LKVKNMLCLNKHTTFMRYLNSPLFKASVIVLGVAAVSISSAKAQDFVDTTPQNKNVVLEEFTGLNCPFCPDGHKIANNIRSNNPGDVVLINVHTGGYARPEPGQPDFRSGYGASLASQLGVRAYPNASVNRTPYNGNKSFGRTDGKWKNAAQQILKESSPVNVGVQTNLNPDTRELTVNVEIYYTDSSSVDANKLNVALLQNDIPAYQSASSIFYPGKVLSNGEYEHEHMLREFLTGQWGDDINKPYEGNLIEKSYTYQVPEDYNSVPVNLAKLEVAAYVAKGKENILSGTSQKVDLPDANLTDVAVSNATSDKGLCTKEVDPAFKIENKGNQAVNDFKLSFRFQGQIYERTFNETIQPGSNTTIKWGTPLKFDGGSYDIKVERIGALNGGDVYDEKLNNNFPNLFSGINFPKVNVDSNFRTSFEGELSNSVAIDDSKNPAIGRVSSNDNPVGAQNTNSAIRQLVDPRFRSNSGEKGYILLGKTRLRNVNTPYLTYYYAYSKGQRNVSNLPEITLQYSKDCGQSWKTVNKKIVEETNSFNPSNQRSNVFAPSSSDYKQAEFDLTSMQDEGEAILRLALPGEDGNAIYLDELQIGSKWDVTGIANAKKEEVSTSVFPNPAAENLQLDINLKQPQQVNVKVVNAIGKTVKAVTSGDFQKGSNRINFNVSSWKAGLYIAQVNIDGQTHPVRFVVEN
jgi:hypothetical protein